MTTKQWSNERLAQAMTQLQLLVNETTGHGGATYKAGRLLAEWRPAYKALGDSARKLQDEFRKSVPDGQGGTVKLPAMQDGQPLPAHIWASDAEGYAARDRELMDMVTEVNAPVRFTYEELVAIPTLRGTIWEALGDLVDAPKEATPNGPTAPATPQG